MGPKRLICVSCFCTKKCHFFFQVRLINLNAILRTYFKNLFKTTGKKWSLLSFNTSNNSTSYLKACFREAAAKNIINFKNT